jgi:hypothetical protein
MRKNETEIDELKALAMDLDNLFSALPTPDCFTIAAIMLQTRAIKRQTAAIDNQTTTLKLIKPIRPKA